MRSTRLEYNVKSSDVLPTLSILHYPPPFPLFCFQYELTYLLTYLLTYSMVQDIIGKLIVTQLVKKYPSFLCN